MDAGIGDGTGTEGFTCAGDGGCAIGFGGLDPLTTGVVLAAPGVPVSAAAVEACWVGGCPCCCC